jgi:hypothetical protein
MLVDINFDWNLINKSNENLRKNCSLEEYEEYAILSLDKIMTKIKTGIYYTGLNFNHYIEVFSKNKIINEFDCFLIKKKDEKNSIDWEYYNESGVEPKATYGVCDNYKQVLKYYPELNNTNKKFVISLYEINKENQPSEGGWRWHKWGNYIGKQKPCCEYIYDEPIIEKVYVYSIYEIE